MLLFDFYKANDMLMQKLISKWYQRRS